MPTIRVKVPKQTVKATVKLPKGAMKKAVKTAKKSHKSKKSKSWFGF